MKRTGLVLTLLLLNCIAVYALDFGYYGGQPGSDDSFVVTRVITGGPRDHVMLSICIAPKDMQKTHSQSSKTFSFSVNLTRSEYQDIFQHNRPIKNMKIVRSHPLRELDYYFVSSSIRKDKKYVRIHTRTRGIRSFESLELVIDMSKPEIISAKLEGHSNFYSFGRKWQVINSGQLRNLQQTRAGLAMYDRRDNSIIGFATDIVDVEQALHTKTRSRFQEIANK